MATVTEMRAWLLAQGHEVPRRGPLPQDAVNEYDSAHGSDNVAYLDAPGAVSEADFGADDDDLEPPAPPMKAESRPRTGRQMRAADRVTTRRGRTDRWIGKLLGEDPPPGGKAKAKAKPKHARISLDKLVTRIYTRAGQMASSVAPATGRCLQAQAAMAGVILEDVARGTLMDRMLQPVARAEDKADKVFALAAPPLIVFALEASPPEDVFRRQMLMGFLRESLAISLEVTEVYADQITANLQRNAEREAEVDALINTIFGVPQAEAQEPDAADLAGAVA